MTTYLDERPRPIRQLSRFIAFGVIVLLAVSGLTARLFYLQIIDGGRSRRCRHETEPSSKPFRRLAD